LLEGAGVLGFFAGVATGFFAGVATGFVLGLEIGFLLAIGFSLLETGSSGAVVLVQSTKPNPKRLQFAHTQKFRLQSRAL
jgi:hypothetical protein